MVNAITSALREQFDLREDIYYSVFQSSGNSEMLVLGAQSLQSVGVLVTGF